MNHLHEVTAQTLTKQLGVEIPDIFVIVAKHDVMGMDREGIKQVLGATTEEILEIESDENYKRVRDTIAGIQAHLLANQSTGWDAIESIAVNNLVKRLPNEKDSEFLLKVAAVANKAQRRHGQSQDILDPSRAPGRVSITLSQRLVSRLNRQGEQIQEETRTISIHDGTMGRATFDEVDSLLDVKSQPVLPQKVEISSRQAEPDMKGMIRDILQR